MKTRAYEFVTGIESSTQPDAGTPTDPNDLVTLSYIGGIGVGTPIQEVPTGLVNGANVTYTLSQTPLAAASFKLFINGRKAILGAEFSRVGITITIIGGALPFGTTIEADYSY